MTAPHRACRRIRFQTTTTANAGPVMAHMEMLLQTAWPELRVHLTSVSDQWAGIAVAGPKSRELLSALGTDIYMSDEAFPFMGVREGKLDNAPVRIFRISFSGERLRLTRHPTSAMPASDRGWGIFGVVPYGTEVTALRIEKGMLRDRTRWLTTMDDLGLEDGKHEETLCRQCLEGTSGFAGGGSVKLVGLIPVDRSLNLRSGASARRTVRAEEPSVRDVHLRRIDGEARDRWQSWLYHIGLYSPNSATMLLVI